MSGRSGAHRNILVIDSVLLAVPAAPTLFAGSAGPPLTGSRRSRSRRGKLARLIGRAVVGKSTAGVARSMKCQVSSATVRKIPVWVAVLLLLFGGSLACGDGAAGPVDASRPTTVTVIPPTATLMALGATVPLAAEVRDQKRARDVRGYRHLDE